MAADAVRLNLMEGEDILEAGIRDYFTAAGKKITEYDAAFRWRKSTDGNCTAVCHSEFKTVTVLSAWMRLKLHWMIPM